MGKCKEYRDVIYSVIEKTGNYHWKLIRAAMSAGN